MNLRPRLAFVFSVALLAPLALSAREPIPPPAVQVARVLDDFHRAAAEADETRYFGHLAEHAVFLGTDGTERWEKEPFRAFAHPYFSQGKGWTFTPRDRHVTFSTAGDVAWFDEALDSATYGPCRGTGVLERIGKAWRITQYNLSIPIPNHLADDVVARIRSTPPPQ